MSWEHCVDDNAHPRINTHLGWLTSQEPPLPGGFTRGDVVWAGCNIAIVGQNDKDIVGVKKHTKGSLIGPSIRDPTERLVVSWSQNDGTYESFNVFPKQLTPREGS